MWHAQQGWHNHQPGGLCTITTYSGVSPWTLVLFTSHPKSSNISEISTLPEKADQCSAMFCSASRIRGSARCCNKYLKKHNISDQKREHSCLLGRDVLSLGEWFLHFQEAIILCGLLVPRWRYYQLPKVGNHLLKKTMSYPRQLASSATFL